MTMTWTSAASRTTSSYAGTGPQDESRRKYRGTGSWPATIVAFVFAWKLNLDKLFKTSVAGNNVAELTNAQPRGQLHRKSRRPRSSSSRLRRWRRRRSWRFVATLDPCPKVAYQKYRLFLTWRTSDGSWLEAMYCRGLKSYQIVWSHIPNRAAVSYTVL